jgi:PKD repeat protein
MKSLLPGLLVLISFVGFAQQSRNDQLIPVLRQVTESSVKSLEARFTADITQGPAPLSVQFTDQSTGNPTSWKWTFGDGDSSLLQHPVHIYQLYGSYTVKLTISDGTSGFALEKKDYITVKQNYVNCDTLRYPLPEPLIYYIIPNKGYVTGNNSYKDKAISDYFGAIQPNQVITGMLCEFSLAKQAPGNNEYIQVKMWDHNSSTGKPGNVLVTDTIMLSEIVSNVSASKISTIDFDNPVHPGNSFYMGVMLPVITGDSVCLWSTSIGKLSVNTTWILQSNDDWESAQLLWSGTGQPPFIISCAIYPKICMLNGIDRIETPVSFAIWPNPARDIITIVNQQSIHDHAEYSIADISGKELLNGQLSESLSTTIDVSRLKAGIYFVRIKGEGSIFSSKLIIR